jgi:hypothetical protein
MARAVAADKDTANAAMNEDGDGEFLAEVGA